MPVDGQHVDDMTIEYGAGRIELDGSDGDP